MRRDRCRSGFTLVELLAVLAVVAVLLCLLLPALASVQREMRSLKCLSNLRSICLKFQLFALGDNAEGRGDSERLKANEFFISDFVECIYRIDEYWDLPNSPVGTLHAAEDIALCPEGARQVNRRRNLPCSSDAISPVENVSLGVNMRLYRAEVEFDGRRVLAPSASTRVRTDVRDHQYVPLIMDVDGKLAARRNIEPFFVAPPLAGDAGPYATGRYWIPSKRHRRRVHVGFVGGQVLPSANPERERWDWGYQAEVSR